MVRTLATLLMTYKQRPSLSDCGAVAKSLVNRFPFLTDSEETGEVCFSMCKLSIFDIYTICFTVLLEVVHLQQSTEYQQELQT